MRLSRPMNSSRAQPAMGMMTPSPSSSADIKSAFSGSPRGSRGAIDDLAQEIFIRAYRRLGQFRGDAPFEHWLSRIAVRCCYDFLRKRKPDHVAIEEWDGATPAPNEAVERIERALSQLSADQRLVITLLELEEHSVREVAALTHWSESAVKVRAFRSQSAQTNFGNFP